MTEHDLQEYANIACLYLNIEPIRVQVKGGINSGRARIKTRTITIPAWTFKVAPEYAVYYTLHEIAHFKFLGHKAAFKEVEQSLCKMAGISLEYAKAYPKAIYANGQRIDCSSKEIRKLAAN